MTALNGRKSYNEIATILSKTAFKSVALASIPQQQQKFKVPEPVVKKDKVLGKKQHLGSINSYFQPSPKKKQMTDNQEEISEV